MLAFLRCGLIFLSMILSLPAAFFAQAAEQKTNVCCSNPGIEEAESRYLTGNQYSEFIDFLNNFKDKDKTAQLCVDYSKANARYLQLKYLEEKQSWDDYFTNGNTYREELVQSAENVINQADSTSCLRTKSRLLLWQFHRDQQDAFAQSALDDLITQVHVYARETSSLDLIKEVADKLVAYQEVAKGREIYKLYVDGLVAQKITGLELKAVADGFYKQGNFELAQSIYNIYIEEISKTLTLDKLVPELFEIGNRFVYKPTGSFDMAYAEEIYARIEALGQPDAFDQDAIYLRAFNLEKMKAYKEAQKFYLQVAKAYPSKHFEEATYKIAMINAYALANISEARRYFEVLSVQSVASPHVISSLYQLGLLAQWQGDLVSATNNYELLLKNAPDNYTEILAQANERIKEIKENKPLSYNLKTFLDLSLKSESLLVEMNKAQLTSSSYILEKNQKVSVSSMVNMPQSGCNQVDLQYLWSGDLGGANPGVTESNFEGAYAQAGTKQINIVIISPAGTVDRSFTMVDVY